MVEGREEPEISFGRTSVDVSKFWLNDSECGQHEMIIERFFSLRTKVPNITYISARPTPSWKDVTVEILSWENFWSTILS